MIASLSGCRPVDGDGDIDRQANLIGKPSACREVGPAVLFNTKPFSWLRLMLPRLRLGGGGDGVEAFACVFDSFNSVEAGRWGSAFLANQRLSDDDRIAKQTLTFCFYACLATKPVSTFVGHALKEWSARLNPPALEIQVNWAASSGIWSPVFPRFSISCLDECGVQVGCVASLRRRATNDATLCPAIEVHGSTPPFRGCTLTTDRKPTR